MSSTIFKFSKFLNSAGKFVKFLNFIDDIVFNFLLLGFESDFLDLSDLFFQSRPFYLCIGSRFHNKAGSFLSGLILNLFNFLFFLLRLLLLWRRFISAHSHSSFLAGLLFSLFLNDIVWNFLVGDSDLLFNSFNARIDLNNEILMSFVKFFVYFS